MLSEFNYLLQKILAQKDEGAAVAPGNFYKAIYLHT